jgi:hypothetical protein
VTRQAERLARPLKRFSWRSKSHTSPRHRTRQSLLVGRKEPEGQTLAHDVVLGLLLLVGQVVAFPMYGSITPLRLLLAALVHELEQAASLAVWAGAANRLCSFGHRALLRTPNRQTATARFRSAAGKSGY